MRHRTLHTSRPTILKEVFISSRKAVEKGVQSVSFVETHTKLNIIVQRSPILRWLKGAKY